MNEVVEETSWSITNLPKRGRINFSQSAPRDITYNLEGRYPIPKGNYSGNNKDYETYDNLQIRLGQCKQQVNLLAY